jgi:hypothetical protein
MVNLRIQKRYVCARGVVLVGRRGEAREAGSTARRGAGKDMRWIEGCAKEIEKRGVDGKTRRGEARQRQRQTNGSRSLGNWNDHDYGDEQGRDHRL